MSSDLKGNWRFFLHNTVLHPIAGVLWFFGFEKQGDRIHDLLPE